MDEARMDEEGRFEFRSIESTEFEEWLFLLVDAFSEKPKPPSISYFRSHFENDPYKDTSLIYVAVDKPSGKLISSVRIFYREVNHANNVIKIAGQY